MKFGIDAPWYDDPVERVAFNLYAMDISELDEIARGAYSAAMNGDGWIDFDEIQRRHGLTDAQVQYIYEEIERIR